MDFSLLETIFYLLLLLLLVFSLMKISRSMYMNKVADCDDNLSREVQPRKTRLMNSCIGPVVVEVND